MADENKYPTESDVEGFIPKALQNLSDADDDIADARGFVREIIDGYRNLQEDNKRLKEELKKKEN